MKKPSAVEALGFRKDWIYESILSTYSGGKAHFAPMGVSTPDMLRISAEIYKTSETCANISSRPVFTVNLSSDVSLFYDSLYRKEALVYGRMGGVDAPVLAQADASLAVSVQESIDLGERVRFIGKVLGYCGKEPSEIKLVNRGDALALEALVAATKMRHVPAAEQERISEEIRRICRVVSRVAPGSHAAKLADDLSSKL
jgi:hypothetical protein